MAEAHKLLYFSAIAQIECFMTVSYDFSDSLLINDFDSFLHYLTHQSGLSLTGAGDLKSADLWAINERMNHKAPTYVTAKSRLMDYPFLGLLFQISTASRLFVVLVDKTNTLVPNATRLDAYHNLTLEEKYVFLLETAWCYVDWGLIDGDGRSGLGADWFRTGVRRLLQNPVGAAVTLTPDWTRRDQPHTIFASSMANAYIRVGYWFGWYDIREVDQPKRDKYSLQIDQITLTTWGDQCLTVLFVERPFLNWNKNANYYAFSLEEDTDEPVTERVDVNQFAKPFRALLDEPDLLSLYPISQNPPTGEFRFRVELPHHGVSRVIAIPAIMTLNDLHRMIQEAFNFDNDHLYYFYLNPRNPHNGESFGRPEDEWSESPSADTVTLAQLNLYEGQSLLYVFDLAERWEFSITVVRHLPAETTTKARVVEKTGRSPKQYRSW